MVCEGVGRSVVFDVELVVEDDVELEEADEVVAFEVVLEELDVMDVLLEVWLAVFEVLAEPELEELLDALLEDDVELVELLDVLLEDDVELVELLDV